MELRKYLEVTATKHSWFAKEIGITKAALVNYLKYNRPIGIGYWSKIIEKTRGRVGIYDLMMTHSKDFKDFDIKQKGLRCIISLKKQNKV